MAKENYCSLIGELQDSPLITENDAKLIVKTLRRNDKIDFPVIVIYDKRIIEKLDKYEAGNYLVIKGIVSTRNTIKNSCCPYCNEYISSEGMTTEVIAVDIINIGSNYDLYELKESSNLVMLLGSLCKDPEYRLLGASSTPSMQYQLAVNRKLVVKELETPQESDYPWIASFGRNAEQDREHLKSGSQVFVQGGLQTRQVQRIIRCPNCEGDFKVEDYVAEVVPYSVEYLNNCIF